jgi:hypothetical protein
VSQIPLLQRKKQKNTGIGPEKAPINAVNPTQNQQLASQFRYACEQRN